jgi:hypothetical protein
MRFHISYTTLINPPTANPTLTRPQVWTGLQRKIRHAEEFVPVITSCKVLLDAEDGVVTRQVKFDDGGTPAQVMELVRSYWPSWVRTLSLYLNLPLLFSFAVSSTGDCIETE